MQINDLKLSVRRKRKRIVGRGGKRGTYATRGIKGQKSRTGSHVNPLFEGGRSTLTDHMKKRRGFTSIFEKPVIVKFANLSKKFDNGANITLEELVKNNLVDKKDLKRGVKILGPKDGKKTFSFEEKIKFSKSVE
jgi:large subunit ribosomal protein L15